MEKSLMGKDGGQGGEKGNCSVQNGLEDLSEEVTFEWNLG